MDAITICAANYLPFVKILGKSFLKSNENSTFTVLVIDANEVPFNKDPDFAYMSPNDLDIAQDIFKNMAFYYNVTELATALKPTALKAMFRRGSSKVIYLDPDIQVFGDFSDLNDLLDDHPIVLTPHTLEPIPRDGLRPTEADIMSSGVYNLGFLALSKSATCDDLLNWWEERLRFDSISDPVEMLFTDQRWIDLIPSYFPIKILRHPGYNVAYWNLHERKLSSSSAGIQVNNQPLKFFHFSGYSPNKPWILSKYVSDLPRIVISANPIVENLCAEYGAEAISSGWTEANSGSYGYQNFENGKFIPSSLRRLYREDCINAFKKGEILKPPNNWQVWASERSIDSGNLSRILFSIWKSRPDLKRRYPDATGTEANDLLAWASTHGVEEKVIDRDFLEIGALANDKIPSKFSNKKGINVAGYLNGELGLGQSARLILEAARATRLPVTTINSNRISSRKEESFLESQNDLIYPTTIAIVNADHFKLWVNDFGVEKLAKTYVIGVWAWETEDFPISMHSAFEYVDEIWAVSEFVKHAISKHTKKPVFTIPTPILTPRNVEKLDRSLIGIDSRIEYNLFIFDYASVFNRKNPMGLAQAHMEAFPDQDGPTLVIKSTNGDKDAENREKLRYFVRDRKDIVLVENYLSRDQLTALVNECKVYVSLHRSEGYGLTIAEALSLGKTVIATGYSGNIDFMNDSNSYLVPIKKIKIGEGSFPYDADSYWAEPDIAFTSRLLRNLYFENDIYKRSSNKIEISLEQVFSIENCARFISKRIERNYFFKIKKKFLKWHLLNTLLRVKRTIKRLLK